MAEPLSDLTKRANALARELHQRPEAVHAALDRAVAAGWDIAEAEKLVREGQRGVGDGLAVLDGAVLAKSRRDAEAFYGS